MKKQQPQISEDLILQASWGLLGEEGIEKFSMRRLADRLGIQAPSIYWYFKSKQSLYQRLANEVSRVILEEYQPRGDWREQLTGLATAVRSVLSRYPCSTQLMMMTLPHEPDIIRLINRLLLCLESTSLRHEHKYQAALTIMNYVYYFVLDDYQHQRNVSAISSAEEGMPQEKMLQLLDSMGEAEAGLFRGIYKSEIFELMGSDASFEFGLNVIQLGIEQVMKSGAGNE